MAHHALHPHDSAEPSAFMSGFTIGLFAGAAGYFLFATPKGEKLRHQLLVEWEQAREHLVEEGVLKPETTSLRQLVRDLVNKAVQPVEEDVTGVERKQRLLAQRIQRKKTTGHKFRGV